SAGGTQGANALILPLNFPVQLDLVVVIPSQRGIHLGLESGIAYGSRRYYHWPMTTMTLKLSETLRRGVEEEARRRGVPKSVLVRECMEAMLRRKQRR